VQSFAKVSEPIDLLDRDRHAVLAITHRVKNERFDLVVDLDHTAIGKNCFGRVGTIGTPTYCSSNCSLCYNASMKTLKSASVLHHLVAPLGDCLTPESARRLLKLKADPELQARVDDLAQRHTRGKLTPEEQAEYGHYVSYSTFVAILKSKARQLLAKSEGK
jgi:hypothetical protein